LSFLKFYTVD